MRLILFIFFILAPFNALLAQVIIVDSNKKPIAYVHISSSNSNLDALTDAEGFIKSEVLKNITETDTVYFSHVSYKPLNILKKDIQSIDTIVLLNQEYNLKDVNVIDTIDKKNFFVMDACYRSYQLNNDSMIYYRDGKVDYINKIGKQKYDIKRKMGRILTNRKMEASMKHRQIAIIFYPSVPSLFYGYLPAYYIKKNKLKTTLNEYGDTIITTQDGYKVGNIKSTPNLIIYSIHDDRVQEPKKALKTEVIFRAEEFILIFKNTENGNPAAINKFDNLLYFKHSYELKYKHDKDRQYTKVNSVSEIFVENTQFKKTINKNEYKDRYGMPQKSNYSSEFWNNCNCEFYYSTPAKLLRGLTEG